MGAPGVGRANVINRLRQREGVLGAKSAGSQTMSAVALSPRGAVPHS